MLRHKLYWPLALGLFLALALCSAFSQVVVTAPREKHDLARKIDLPIDEWLRQGERIDVPWKVALSKPVLTFQLRTLVRVTAVLPADLLQKQGVQHDLHFVVKAASEGGPWDEGESYSRFRIESKLANNTELQMVADVYLQSGTYTIATILYDAMADIRNVSFSRVQVASDQDPSPELLSRLPKVQFLPPPENAAPLGGGRISLPITTQRPVQLDLIVDLSTREEEAQAIDPGFDPDWARPPIYPTDRRPDWATRRTNRRDTLAAQERYDRSRLLQAATVLSAIDLKEGCIEVTAFDILRRRIILPLTPASEVNWDKMREEEVLGSGSAMVSVSDLKDKQKSGKFFQETVEQRITRSTDCKLKSSNTLHMIVILSRGVSLPPGSLKPKIPPECNCKVFYLQQVSQYGSGGDDLKNMLMPLSPRILQFRDPQDFRKKLLEFARTIEKLS